MKFDAATDGFGEAGYEANCLIDRGLVVAGRLDLDEIAQRGCKQADWGCTASRMATGSFMNCMDGIAGE